MDYIGLIYEGHHPLATPSRDAAVDADFKFAKTSVWWDIDNCEVPRGCDPNLIAQNIRSVLLEKNYCGSVLIYAYGDTSRIPSTVQQALYSTGVLLNHVPAGVKDGSDKKILVDMMLWAMDNRAPANIMLISGDRDFSYVLHQLGMKRYNILLARPEKASVPLIASAKTVWLWTNIATGDGPKIPTDSGRYHHHHHHHPSGSEVLRDRVSKQDEPRKMMDPSYLVRGRRSSFCELCNVACSHHDLRFHLSGRKHRTQVMLEAMYETHMLGRSHRNELEDQSERSPKRACRMP